jgi:Flp pilus assembly protein TadG
MIRVGHDSGSQSTIVRAGRRAAGRLRRWLGRGDRSVVSLELGIIAVPFFGMFLGIMEISYDLFVQSELDNAVEIAARGVQVGAHTGYTLETSAQFIAQNVCPNISGALNCNLLTVAVVPLQPKGVDTNYYNNPIQTTLTQTQANNGSGICTGTAGQLMVIKVWYDGPTFVGLLVPSFTKTWNNTIVHETSASAGWVNEYFTTGGQSGAAGACTI